MHDVRDKREAWESATKALQDKVGRYLASLRCADADESPSSRLDQLEEITRLATAEEQTRHAYAQALAARGQPVPPLLADKQGC